MGTNYYLQTDVCQCCGRPKEILHIGKSSCGWKFSFRVYENIKNVADWIRLIEDKDNTIKDYYDEKISSAAFIDLIDSKVNGKSHLDYDIPDCLINDYSTDGKYDYIKNEFS